VLPHLIVVRWLVALVALLAAFPSLAHAEAPMCDETAATVLVPGPTVPAPLAEDGEIRQGAPCKSKEKVQRLQPGAPSDQRVGTSIFEAPPDATPWLHDVLVVGTGVIVSGPPPDERMPVLRDRASRIYRPPR